MLVRLYTIVSLLIFIALIYMGSAVEAAMFKSATVFIVLIIGTKISVYLLDIIKEQSPKEQESASQN